MLKHGRAEEPGQPEALLLVTGLIEKLFLDEVLNKEAAPNQYCFLLKRWFEGLSNIERNSQLIARTSQTSR